MVTQLMRPERTKATQPIFTIRAFAPVGRAGIETNSNPQGVALGCGRVGLSARHGVRQSPSLSLYVINLLLTDGYLFFKNRKTSN